MFLISLIIAFSIFVLCLIGAIVISVIPYKRDRFITPFILMAMGVVIAGFTLLIPQYISQYNLDASSDWFKIIIYSIHNTIRLLFVNDDFSMLLNTTETLPTALRNCFRIFDSLIYLMAPFFLFGTILSFFKGLSAYRRLYFSLNIALCKKELHIFSKLNEKSITLAESLINDKGKKKDVQIIFTCVSKEDNNTKGDLVERAKEMSAIVFEKEMSAISFNGLLSLGIRKKILKFYAIAEEDVDNIQDGTRIIEKYRTREIPTFLFLFSWSTASEQQIMSLDAGCVRVRRINTIRYNVDNFLFNQGKTIFDYAIEVPNANKRINAVVIGNGQYGKMMAKSLVWFAQMDGYDLYLDIFDKDSNVKSIFEQECPELMDDKNNGNFTRLGDARYQINIHDNVEVDSKEFQKGIENLKDASYIFISLGDEDLNLKTAMRLAIQYKRFAVEGYKEPFIHAVLSSSYHEQGLQGSIEKAGKYPIHFMGGLTQTYDYFNLIEPEFDALALGRHTLWDKSPKAIDSFYRYEYNYLSSLSSVIHYKYRFILNIPGSDRDFATELKQAEQNNKKLAQKDEKVMINLLRLEHCRWNAFLRSEGWSYNPVRNDAAKLHNCLVDFEDLSLKEKLKDMMYIEDVVKNGK